MRSLVEIVLLKRAAEQANAVTKPDLYLQVRGRMGGRPPTLLNAILAAMKTGQHTSASLSRELSYNRKGINDALQRLHREGRVRKISYGVYVLAVDA